ncbi:MAG: ABC transporter permease [Vicinamibacteria bacterium]|nr:ABC transporter permease [Vicinamibacteria bacterium]
MKTLLAELRLVLRLFQADVTHNRKRIALTVIAIGWGTLSIVMLLSFGEGLRRSFYTNTRGMGVGIAVVWPGATTRPWAGLPAGRNIQFTDEDAELLAARIPEIDGVSREYATRRGVTVGEKTINARVRGVDARFGAMRNITPQAGGRFLNERDIEEKRRVVVLGDELAQDLFGSQDVVGRTVQIQQSTFTVVGVAIPKTMMGMYSGPDKGQATIPATTYKSMWTDHKMSNLIYRPLTPELGDQAKAQIYRILGGRYRFDPDDLRALGVWDTRRNQQITDNIALGIQMFLGLIGALTLFVGGMGVANIMYAVVQERTREIGLKMALGAKARQVMAPFVVEALMMTAMGGLLGTFVSLTIITGIGLIPVQDDALAFLGKPTFSLPIAAATALILGSVGALAGFFPARHAAAVQPAVSLRYE